MFLIFSYVYQLSGNPGLLTPALVPLENALCYLTWLTVLFYNVQYLIICAIA